MHHDTMYHLFILTILSTVSWLLIKIILYDLDVYEYLLLTLIFYPILMIPVIYYKKGNLSIDKKKINFKTLLLLAVIMFLFVNTDIHQHFVLKNEDISTSPSLIYGFRILFIFILGILLLNEKLTIKKLFSLVSILIGLFLFSTETNNK